MDFISSQDEVNIERSICPRHSKLLNPLALRARWDEKSRKNLHAAVEETILSLLYENHDSSTSPSLVTTKESKSQLYLMASVNHSVAELEFIFGGAKDNLEDRLAVTKASTDHAFEEEMSLRLLRRFASSVRHQQYHDSDIITVRVNRVNNDSSYLQGE